MRSLYTSIVGFFIFNHAYSQTLSQFASYEMKYWKLRGRQMGDDYHVPGLLTKWTLEKCAGKINPFKLSTSVITAESNPTTNSTEW